MFTGKTILERISSKEYMLKSSLTYENEEFKVTIKKGLITDGASIPKAFWSIIGCPLSGKYVGSALIHDGLYGSHLLSKEESDRLFLDMMKHNGVGAIKRNLMYWAVKVGGRSAYNATSAESAIENAEFVSVKRK